MVFESLFESIGNLFENLLDPIFNPLLKLPPVLAILILAFVLTLIVTLVYKFTTDQEKLKKLRGEMKEKQKKLREVMQKDPQKASKLQQEMWASQGPLFKESMRPVLYTFIPFIIIFAWLNAHMAYYQIMPGQEFTISAEFAEGHAPTVMLSTIPDLEFLSNQTQEIADEKAVWKLKGDAGEYRLILDYNSEKYEEDSRGKPLNFIINEERDYEEPNKIIKDSKLKKIVVGNEKIYPLKDLLGWKLSWIWVYIIFSMIISIGLRKVLKVY
ncbi:hypothetical protein AYK26_03320 [Euryarchaeota archaeon SM23-78]|nr:MAG: hypothetical protein AYK26_03320 [Euryarchaeota archaeon SM23-78]MBW3000812.1 DUF106 domain-containing protein [Candidatus Woesearchaeota archaeon]